MTPDARLLAASVLRQVENESPPTSFLCYGTADNVLLGLGRKRSLEITATSSLDEIWAAIDDFVTVNSGETIIGFIGFDPSNELHREVENYRQKVDLFVPETLIEFSRTGYTVRTGEWDEKALLEPAVQPRSAALNPCQFDRESYRADYSHAVSRVLDRLRRGIVERVTLARRIDVDKILDLLAIFQSEGSQHECARNFYFASELIRFAGQSPELLAEGSVRCFHTHKLSGTYRRSAELSTGELARRFQADERIRAEHFSSITAIENSLAELGALDSEKFQVMELPSLLHGWSRFTTRPRQPLSVAKCLRAVFPFGVQPMQQGLELLRENENFLRGPYYGLVGYIRSDGEFSFTQVLRTAFADAYTNYLVVGAAITNRSSPELEVAETCAKLSGVRLFENTHPGN